MKLHVKNQQKWKFDINININANETKFLVSFNYTLIKLIKTTFSIPTYLFFGDEKYNKGF